MVARLGAGARERAVALLHEPLGITSRCWHLGEAVVEVASCAGSLHPCEPHLHFEVRPEGQGKGEISDGEIAKTGAQEPQRTVEQG